MIRRTPARHAAPRGRRAVEAAHAALLDSVSELRRAQHRDSVEIVRLTALAESLAVENGRLVGELTALRRDLAAVRATPPPPPPGPDPVTLELLGRLARETTDLRAALLDQQAQMAALTRTLLEALARVPAEPAADQAPITAVAPGVDVGPDGGGLPGPQEQRGSGETADEPAVPAAPRTSEPVRRDPVPAGAGQPEPASVAVLVPDVVPDDLVREAAPALDRWPLDVRDRSGAAPAASDSAVVRLQGVRESSGA